MSRINGAYAVCVGSSISDDPVRWLFVDEAVADDFAAAINEGREDPEAWVTFEPIAWSLHDNELRSAFPETRDRGATAAREDGSSWRRSAALTTTLVPQK